MSFRGCLSGGGDIFSKSVEKQGGANRTFATGGRCHGWQLEPCPYGLEPLNHFSIENSHLETRHQGMMFRSPRAFVGSTATLRYEPCTQFINVSQRALHIYFIDGCRVCPLDAQYKNRVNQPRLCASAHRGVPLYFCMARNSQFTHFQSASRWAPRRVLSRSCWSC